MYNAFWRHGLFVRGQSFSVKNFWQFTQLLPGNWRGGGKRFSGAFRAGAPSPPAFLLLERPFFLVPTTSKRLLRRLSCRRSRFVNSAFSNKKILFMTNKFKRKCLQKFYVWSKQEKEWNRKTTYYLEQPSRHFCQHFMRRTTQQTLLAINFGSQQKTTKLYFSSQVTKQFKLLAVPFKPLRCCLRSDKLVNCHV